MASSTHTAASIIQSDEVPCCGCFGQASPRAKPRPSSPHLQSVCRPQAPKAKEPEQIGGWTIGAELSGGCDSTHPTGNTPQQLHRLPSGAEELHEVRLDSDALCHLSLTPNSVLFRNYLQHLDTRDAVAEDSNIGRCIPCTHTECYGESATGLFH